MNGSSDRDEAVRRRLEALGVRPQDIEESFSRSGGKGGQNVNKVSTRVLLRHLPTGTVVRCEELRSQAANRLLARERLAERLEALRREALDRLRQDRERARRASRRPPKALRRRWVEDKRLRSRLKGERRFDPREIA